MNEILKVLVGSRAHGLNHETSDFDYRSVFWTPTCDLLKVGAKPKSTQWLEGDIDNTSWELGNFLNLATHCNPTILEVFLGPVQTSVGSAGYELRALFPSVWNSTGVKNAFVGYGLNQRKKFLDDKDNRREKYAVAYLRTLYNALELLKTGTFSVRMVDTEIFPTLVRWRKGEFETGEVIDTTAQWANKVEWAYNSVPHQETDTDAVNAFLLEFRRNHWYVGDTAYGRE